MMKEFFRNPNSPAYTKRLLLLSLRLPKPTWLSISMRTSRSAIRPLQKIEASNFHLSIVIDYLFRSIEIYIYNLQRLLDVRYNWQDISSITSSLRTRGCELMMIGHHVKCKCVTNWMDREFKSPSEWLLFTERKLPMMELNRIIVRKVEIFWLLHTKRFWSERIYEFCTSFKKSIADLEI